MPGATPGLLWGRMRCPSPRRLRSGRRWLSEPAKRARDEGLEDEAPVGVSRVRRPRLILGGSVLYLALIFGVMLWRGISIEPEWVVLALLVIAVALGRGRAFVVDWAPFLLLFFAYEAMRGYAGQTGFAPHDLSGLERAVFAGTLPTITLQHAFYRPDNVSVQDTAAMFFYFMHFPLPIVVGFFFWIRSRDHYRRFIAALLLMALLAFVTYLFWPSAPPWYQFQASTSSGEET